MNIRLVSLCIAVVVLAGCGGGEPKQPSSTASLERSIVERYTADGSTMRDVTCVRRGGRVYRCTGDFTPSRANVKRTMSGIDTSGFGAEDWDALIRQRAGPLTLDVTVAEDGTWVADPV